MNIFGNTAAGFSKEVDNAMSTFKSTITKLKATAEKAVATKAEKQDEIKKLESECSALDGVYLLRLITWLPSWKHCLNNHES